MNQCIYIQIQYNNNYFDIGAGRFMFSNSVILMCPEKSDAVLLKKTQNCFRAKAKQRPMTWGEKRVKMSPMTVMHC